MDTRAARGSGRLLASFTHGSMASALPQAIGAQLQKETLISR